MGGLFSLALEHLLMILKINKLKKKIICWLCLAGSKYRLFLCRWWCIFRGLGMPVAWLQGKFSQWSDDTDVVLIKNNFSFFQYFCSLFATLGMALSITIQIWTPRFLKCELRCRFFAWVVFKIGISSFPWPGSFLLFVSSVKFICPCFFPWHTVAVEISMMS